MEDQIEAPVREGQRLRHVGADDLDGIALARGDGAFAFELGKILVFQLYYGFELLEHLRKIFGKSLFKSEIAVRSYISSRCLG